MKLNANEVKLSASFTTGINEQIKNNYSSIEAVYPNPASTETHLKFTLNKTGNVSFIITDLYGKMVNKLPSDKFTTGTHEIILPTGNLANGLYYVTMRTSNISSVKKIIVARY